MLNLEREADMMIFASSSEQEKTFAAPYKIA